ncbi:hypothetical protein J3Q64DRAFT_1645069 [Phycomyces blakesleeanus]|uniref:BEACH domain-containing protein n=1 Tax=Phycomyces blakesleeanus TaxID=4837 RepID=A0ABR3AS14_PHYBL
MSEDSLVGALGEPLEATKPLYNDPANSNLPDVFAIIESENAYYFLASYRGTTLQDLITYNPGVLSSNFKKGFVVYQLLRAVASLHSRGILHGRQVASNILVDENLWTQLAGMECGANPMDIDVKEEPLVIKWVRGEISNYSYIMALNHLAGRKEGDPNFHPILPWVVDFTGTSVEDGWRDFTKTKFRMNKGDEQLDFTFDGPVPHHITDILSDITYYVYLARRTPIPVLCQFVRSKYEPNEYPSSMHRLYEWTPDECIPEFYTDPTIFKSMHSDMPDLQIPLWADSPEDFIKKHAEALESDYVSANLHHWIDLTFGNNLTGKGAVEAKNVALPLLAGQNSFMKHGIIQLFKCKHPQRGCNWHSAKSSMDSHRNCDSGQTRNLSPAPEIAYSASVPSQRSSKILRHISISPPYSNMPDTPSNLSLATRERAPSVHSTTSSIDTSTSITNRSISTDPNSTIGLTSALRTEPIRLSPDMPDDFFTENLTHYEETLAFSTRYNFINEADVILNPVLPDPGKRFSIEPREPHYVATNPFSIGTAYDVSSNVTSVISALMSENWNDRPTAKAVLCASFPAMTLRDPSCSFPFPEHIPEMYEYLAAFYQAEWSRRLYLADKWIDRICDLEDEPIISMFETLRPKIPKILFDQRIIQEFVKRLGIATFLQQMLPCYLEALAINEDLTKSYVDDDVSLAGEALVYICKLLGPVLTSKHIVRQLVKIVFRDNIVKSVLLETVVRISSSFGETFTSIQYAYLITLIDSYQRSVTNAKNCKIVCSIISLLEQLLPYMQNEPLVTELKSGFVTILYKLLEPLPPTQENKDIPEQTMQLRLTISMRTIDYLLQMAYKIPKPEWEVMVGCHIPLLMKMIRL